MKIFLDVGAHQGQSLFSVLDPKYSFDKIFVFEPVKKMHPDLKKVAAGRQNIYLFEYGLWDKNISQKIYSPGTVAGSLFQAHQDVDAGDSEQCEFVNASEWFALHITNEDEVYVKLNCEGAEADILLDLLNSGEIFKISSVMIDFDVKKVKGLENMQQHVLNKFKEANFKSYSLCEDVMIGPTNIVRTQNWLDHAGANETDIRSRVKQFFYWTKMSMLNKRPGSLWELKHYVKAFAPLFMLKILGAKRS
jgi:FkbM family methyltransferase